MIVAEKAERRVREATFCALDPVTARTTVEMHLEVWRSSGVS